DRPRPHSRAEAAAARRADRGARCRRPAIPPRSCPHPLPRAGYRRAVGDASHRRGRFGCKARHPPSGSWHGRGQPLRSTSLERRRNRPRGVRHADETWREEAVSVADLARTVGPLRLGARHYGRALEGIVWREWLRFLGQRGRFFSALVRPLVWLGIFAAG